MVSNAVTPNSLAQQFSQPVRLRPLTVAQYLELVRQGMFDEDDDLELIEGWLVEKTTKGQRHVVSIYKFDRAFHRLIPDSWIIGIEQPIAGATSAPEPDVSVIRGTPEDFLHDPAPGALVDLVVEIADTSLNYDRTDKVVVYARISIPFYWIVNIPDRQIEVHTDPQPDAAPPSYATITIYGEAESVPLVLDGREIAQIKVADLLP